MDWTATIMDFGGIDPARANPDFDGMSFKDTFYNGNDISPSPRKDLFMFMNGSPAVSVKLCQSNTVSISCTIKSTTLKPFYSELY